MLRVYRSFVRGRLDSVYIIYWSLLDPLCQSQSLPYLRSLAGNGYKLGLITFEQQCWRMTAEQSEKVRALYAELKADLEPVAKELAEAKAAATRKGLSILTAEQREKLEQWKDTVLTKVLEFVRG